MYMRANCAERGLQLATSEGSIHVGASEDWDIKSLQISFSAELASGDADEGQVDYIISRMQQCPVSRNLGEIEEAVTRLEFS